MAFNSTVVVPLLMQNDYTRALLVQQLQHAAALQQQMALAALAQQFPGQQFPAGFALPGQQMEEEEEEEDTTDDELHGGAHQQEAGEEVTKPEAGAELHQSHAAIAGVVPEGMEGMMAGMTHAAHLVAPNAMHVDQAGHVQVRSSLVLRVMPMCI